MKKLHVVLIVAVVLLVGLFAAATAQEGGPLAGLVQPLVIDVEQTVPAEVMVAVPIGDAEFVTVTTPITVNVALRLSIDGPQVVTVEPLAVEDERVTISAMAAKGTPLVDETGLEYQIELPDGIEIVQMRVGEDNSGDLLMIGELRNLSDADLERAAFTVTLYDREGNLGNVADGFMRLDEVPPGGTSPFEILTYTPFDLVGSYLIQVEARFDD